jgi:hypothetical protein
VSAHDALAVRGIERIEELRCDRDRPIERQRAV